MRFAGALTNETGNYNIPSLLPGSYKVTAELPGFQTRTFTDVRLGNAGQVRLNFTLQVASLSSTVEGVLSAIPWNRACGKTIALA